jgi:hypothetical protein
MTEILQGQGNSSEHSLSTSPSKDGSPIINEALQQLREISLQGSAARLLANPGVIYFTTTPDVYGSPSDRGSQTEATLVAQAPWVAPPIFKDAGNKEVPAVHADHKASPAVEQKTPTGHSSTEHQAPSHLPTGHDKPAIVPQDSLDRVTTGGA